jgi:hypothetical protein
LSSDSDRMRLDLDGGPVPPRHAQGADPVIVRCRAAACRRPSRARTTCDPVAEPPAGGLGDRLGVRGVSGGLRDHARRSPLISALGAACTVIYFAVRSGAPAPSTRWSGRQSAGNSICGSYRLFLANRQFLDRRRDTRPPGYAPRRR